jgi:hypothetical protein
MMSDKLDWTRKLGDAFLGQQDEVMNEIQFLRAKASEAGHLKTTEQQRVVKRPASGPDTAPIIEIEPISPDAIYVPVYEPSVVYGPWWYPDYPPYAWSYPGATFVNGYFWGAAVAVAASIWGWNRFDWNRRNIHVDVNRWNNINRNRTRISSPTWEHRPDRRGAVPYASKAARDKFDHTARDASKAARGGDKARADRAKVEARLKDTDHKSVRGKSGDKGVKSKSGDKKRADVKDSGRHPAKKSAKKGTHTASRPSTKRPSSGARHVKHGAEVRRHAGRTRASRPPTARHHSMSRPSGGRSRAGGRRR